MQLTVFPFLSAFVFNSVTASTDIDKQSGFNCGRVFFGKNVIRNAGSLVSRNLKRSSQISLVDGVSFHGRDSDHVGWPIRESGQIYGLSRSRENFYIVVDFSGKVKDVMVRLSNDDFTRCLRKKSRRKSLSLDTSNGYRCGQNFFGDEQLRGDVDKAISKLGQGLKYPIPLKGNLYPGHQYFTWPILNEKKANTSQWEQSPFHVILSRDGEIIDVVAKLKCNDFIKCERATKSLRHRFAKSSRLLKGQVPKNFDYFCAKSGHTFTTGYLRVCSASAFEILDRSWSPDRDGISNPKKPLYPMKHTTLPCSIDIPCILWPVLKVDFYTNKDVPGNEFLVLEVKSRKVKGVYTKAPDGFQACNQMDPKERSPPTTPNAGGLVRDRRGHLMALPGFDLKKYVDRTGRKNKK
ncbi:hypothetical protein OnM2_038062 [Erysiphe neolycopersici]|uniref:Uncharacterized protein n=1 Tax=Erysiphe neolycopersici TaxID=212602 RepID=A0A420HWL5_9PEZI|nr:hypothetical protein OnM2_038062 [Erysiphe neolycopersici]